MQLWKNFHFKVRMTWEKLKFQNQKEFSVWLGNFLTKERHPSNSLEGQSTIYYKYKENSKAKPTTGLLHKIKAKENEGESS